MKHPITNRLCGACIVAMLLCPSAGLANTLHVVATQKVPRVERLLDDVRTAVGNAADVQVVDLKGNPKRAKAAIESMRGSIQPGDVVLTLGAPASRYVIEHVGGVPIVCAMTAEVTEKPAENVYFSKADADIATLVDAMTKVWADVREVAVVVSPDSKLPDLSAHGVRVRRIDVSGDVVSALQQAADHVDGFVFPRDPQVLNRRTIQNVTKWLAERGKPAIGYSKFLVSAGFPAAVAKPESEQRAQVSALVVSLLKQQPLNEAATGGSVWLNREVLDRFDIHPDELPMMVHLL